MEWDGEGAFRSRHDPSAAPRPRNLGNARESIREPSYPSNSCRGSAIPTRSNENVFFYHHLILYRRLESIRWNRALSDEKKKKKKRRPRVPSVAPLSVSSSSVFRILADFVGRRSPPPPLPPSSIFSLSLAYARTYVWPFFVLRFAVLRM